MKRKLAVWLALAGMALNALWPLLANASPRDFSMPICSTVGTVSAPVDVGGIPAQPTPAKFVPSHCPFCLGVGDRIAAPAPDVVVAVAAPNAGTQPIASARTLLFSFLHLRPGPRGPPVLS